MKGPILIPALAASLALAGTARAHPMPLSIVDLRLGEATLELSVTAHDFDLGAELGVGPETLLDPARAAAEAAAIARVMSRLTVSVDGRPVAGGTWSAPEVLAERKALRVTWQAVLPAAPARVGLRGTLFPRDPAHQTFVNVYEGGTLATQAILQGGTGFDLPLARQAGWLGVGRKFVLAGVRHIGGGVDHLLFLVGLLLLGGSARRLLLVVSAFTVGHSITLSLATLALVAPPARLVEPAIALTIVCVGADNLLARGGRDLRPWFALAFGLIHGFGFAGALREMGLPRGAQAWALFSFNLGVELGQLALVAVVASGLAALRARSERVGRRIAWAGSVGVVAAGAFWFIQRLFFVSSGGILMKRAFVLGTLIAGGALSIAAASAFQAPAPPATPPPTAPAPGGAPPAAPAPPPGAPPGPKVAKIEKVKDNLYMLSGGGGNTAAFITAKGVVVVDTKNPGWGQAILDQIRTVSDKPISMIINTHTHGDHTGSNEFFGASVETVVQENTKANMEKMDAFKGEKASFLPKKTYKDRTSLLSGKEKIDLYYFGPGHTNGDTFVVFPALGVMHAGDMFAGKSTPFIDTKNGGSGGQYAKTLAKAVAGVKKVDTVITGHSPVQTWSDFKDFASFMKDFTAFAAAQKKEGKTPEEAAARFQVADKYKGYTIRREGFGAIQTAMAAVYADSK